MECKRLIFQRNLNAAQEKLEDLCRDAQSWRRASDEISRGNNNRKGVAQTRRLFQPVMIAFHPPKCQFEDNKALY